MASILELKKREAVLGRQLDRKGFSLRKSRYRIPEVRAAHDGHMIVHLETNAIVAGARPREFSLTIDEAELFLTKDEA